MIESGLYTWAITNSAIQPLLGQSAQEKTAKTYSAFYFSFLPKTPTLPGIILDRLKGMDEVDSFDPRTAQPGVLQWARFQFGAVAQDSSANPANPSGYLSAARLSKELRLQIMGLCTGNAALPDGTLIKDLRIDDEYDAHFEVGGEGYVYRRMLLFTIWFEDLSS
jgi:hypothetical protein